MSEEIDMENEINWTDLMSSERLPIDTMWHHFLKFVTPKETPDIQKREMKKAFYSGFAVCIKIMNDVAPELSESDACLLFDKINKETCAFIKENVGS